MTQQKHTISRASLLTGAHVNTIKNYCREGVVRPETLSNGTRIFSEGDIQAIRARLAANTRRRRKAEVHA